MPDGDGLELLRQLREWSSAPVIVLSARDREDDKVLALDAGADDYLTKPFGTAELSPGSGSRSPRGGQAVPRSGDHDRADADRSGAPRGRGRRQLVHLTPIEFRLLALLARHGGKVLTHRQLLHDVWGPRNTHQTHYLRVHMAALRRKIEADPARPRWLITEAGVGYRLRDE